MGSRGTKLHSYLVVLMHTESAPSSFAKKYGMSSCQPHCPVMFFSFLIRGGNLAVFVALHALPPWLQSGFEKILWFSLTPKRLTNQDLPRTRYIPVLSLNYPELSLYYHSFPSICPGTSCPP